MNTYPKALYKGTKTERQLTKANDKSHEQQLRGQGYVDFANLPDDTASTDCQTLQNDWDDVDKVRERLEELSQDEALPDNHDYESWTVKQLQTQLKQLGITYKTSDNKAQLISMIPSS